MSTLSTIWEILMVVQSNIDAPHHHNLCQFYLDVTQLYLNLGIGAPGHSEEVFDGLNAISKRYMYQLMFTVILPGSKTFDSHILMYSCTPKKDVSLAK